MTAKRASPNQTLLSYWAWARVPHVSRPESGTSVGASPSQQPLPEQFGASNFHRNSYEGVTTEGAGPSQRPLWVQTRARDLCGSRPEPVFLGKRPQLATSRRIGTLR